MEWVLRGWSQHSGAATVKPSRNSLYASWYRDYHELWQSRRHWLTAEAISELESENDRQRRAGTQFGVVDVIARLGAHYRIVVAQPATADQEPPVWPQAAFLVDLRDPPTFQEKFLDPLVVMMRVAALGLGGEVQTAEEDSVEFTTMRLKKSPLHGLPAAVVETISPTLAIGPTI